MSAITQTATTRAAAVAAADPDDATDATRPGELVALLVLFVALVGFALSQLDTALAGFAAVAGQ